MPKIKTNRAAAKRFKKTGTGKLVRNKAYKSHILTKKSQKSSNDGSDKHQEHEEDFTIHLRFVKEDIGNGKS